jgi:hypothetical protein
VRVGKVIRSEDINTEFLFDPELCRGRGILSLLAVPIYHDGDIVGALELYFDRIHGFAEQDIHTCQLMAGLVTEAISRDAGRNLKNFMTAERSTILTDAETLRPLTSVAGSRHATAFDAGIGGSVGFGDRAGSVRKFLCWKCGSGLLVEEQFCGKCGAARATDDEPSDMQSKLALALQMQKAQEAFAAAPTNGTGRSTDDRQRHSESQSTDFEQGALDEELENFPTLERGLGENSPSETAFAEGSGRDRMMAPSNSQSTQRESTALVVAQEDAVWSSAAKARQFLDSVSGKREPGALARYWHSRRGDFYMGFAIILVILVIRWGIWSEPSVGTAGLGSTISGIRRKHFDPNASLSAFDKLLIGMGLAEAPDPPEYKGNPDTQVWVDLHTALYYCPGSDLYGKTANGKTTNQRDAQLDQFEPAYRKACD